jgi:transposase
MNRKKYQTYSKEFKIEAVRLAEQSDKPVTQVARELGIRQNQIYKWKKQLEVHQEKAFPGKGQAVDDENARLRRELAVAKEDIEILKKAAAYFAKELR